MSPLDDLPPEAFKKVYSGKFASKLSFEDRCAILAMVQSSVRREILAEVFGVDRRTVTHIANPAGAHYKDVRRKLASMELAEFAARYVTPKMVERVREVTLATVQAQNAHEPTGSARARGKAGYRTIHPVQCAYPHRIEIAYKRKEDLPSNDFPEGWYFRDLESDSPTDWNHNGEESLKTSQAALAACEANLMD